MTGGVFSLANFVLNIRTFILFKKKFRRRVSSSFMCLWSNHSPTNEVILLILWKVKAYGEGEKMPNVLVNQFRKYCMQALLIAANFVVLLFGLLVLCVGLWALLSEQQYYVITDGDPEFTRIPISLIVVGAFVSGLALLGVVGSIFSGNFCGRIMLGMYAFVLALLIVSELGAGVAAIKFQSELRDMFITSADNSLMMYNANSTSNTSEIWDQFQQTWKCCGDENYTSYRHVFGNNTVPSSCCNLTKFEISTCPEDRLNVTDNANGAIYSTGCPDAVIGTLKHNCISIAVIVISLSVAQVFGIVLSVVVIYLNSRLEQSAKPHAYRGLRQSQAET